MSKTHSQTLNWACFLLQTQLQAPGIAQVDRLLLTGACHQPPESGTGIRMEFVNKNGSRLWVPTAPLPFFKFNLTLSFNPHALKCTVFWSFSYGRAYRNPFISSNNRMTSRCAVIGHTIFAVLSLF